MANAIDEVIGQLATIKSAVQTEEYRRSELAFENAKASEELAKTSEALLDLQGRLDGLQRMMPEDKGDEAICLDVGGRTFKMYRSTLTQFKDSVLAAMVSVRWAEGMRQQDGTLFLDMDPDAFQEIVCYLRSRRMDPAALSSFSVMAADMAVYLGIPVDHMKGTQSHIAHFPGASDKLGNGIAFEVCLPHPMRGSVTAIMFTVTKTVECMVCTKAGRYDGALAKRELWNQVWAGKSLPGNNRVPLNIQLKYGEVHAIYIWCPDLALEYADVAPELSQQQQSHLVCRPGRGLVGDKPFHWPPPHEYVHLESESRYFAGFIEHTIFPL